MVFLYIISMELWNGIPRAIPKAMQLVLGFIHSEKLDN